MYLELFKKQSGELEATYEVAPGDTEYAAEITQLMELANMTWKPGQYKKYIITIDADGTPGHRVIAKAIRPITEQSDSIRVEGHIGTFYVIDTGRFNRRKVFICESEIYGDEALYIAVYTDGTLAADSLCQDDYTNELKEIEQEEAMAYYEELTHP